MEPKANRFKKFNLYTIIAVYFLILVGGIVRNMGAGMGCPDWPKCFGNYIPPASSADLPKNYEEIYKEKRLMKNERLANVLTGLGWDEMASKVLNDPNASKNTSFDTQKAWVEYINRLVGVAIGLLIILNMVFSFKVKNRSVAILGVIAFVLVLFQGWIGSLVVSTNLLPGFITFHMMLALLLVALLIAQRHLVDEKSLNIRGGWILLTVLLLFTIQIVFGTQVREHIDILKTQGIIKTNWMENLGLLFYVHRSYSILLVALIGYLMYLNRTVLFRSVSLQSLGAVVISEILLGVIMTYFDFPAFAQPTHLLLGTLAFGLIFYLFLTSNFKRSIS